MAGDRIVARQGRNAVEVDNSQIRRLADRITGGAVETFIRAAHRQMDPVVNDARSDATLWPRRTGKSQAATVTEDRVRPKFIEVVALNPVPYTYKLRFSVVTAGAIDREARREAGRVWGQLGPYVERVAADDITKSGRYKGQRGAGARVANHYMKTHGDPWGKWWPRERPSEDSLRRGLKFNLVNRHGRGAPSEQLAGKHVWSTRVRNPIRKRESALIDDARGALDSLAKG